jgi:hypothetical protein
LGSHDGLRITSFLGSVALLFATAFFARAFTPGRARCCLAQQLGRVRRLPVLVGASRQLVRGAVVTAWALTHRVCGAPTRRSRAT